MSQIQTEIMSHHSLIDLTAYDDHTQYLLLAGRTGGQTAYGGTAASDTLTLEGTSHDTKGNITLNLAGGNVGVGVAPLAFTKCNILKSGNVASTTENYCLRAFTNATGGTGVGGYARGVQQGVLIADTGAVNYSNDITGLINAVYIGYDIVAGAAVAYTGTVTNATGLNCNVTNLSSASDIITEGRGAIFLVVAGGGIVRTAVGLEINSIEATGVDAGQTHTAYGILIDNQIAATGGATNNAYSIYSLSTADSYLAGHLGIGMLPGTTTLLDLPSTTTKNAAQFGTFGIQSYTVNNGFLHDNGYYDGANEIYRANGAIAMIQFGSTGAGDINLRTAPAGVAGATATLTTRFTVKNTGAVIIGSTDAGGTDILRVNGALTINVASPMIRTKTSFTDGAALQLGTLANAPSAGNPTKWIPIDDNSVTRYIPAW